MSTNSFSSNFSRKIMDKVLPSFQDSRVLSKNINTQMFQGEFNGNSGENVDVKRPTDWKVSETPDGDLTSETESDYITGKATATVQDQLTVFASIKEFDEALKDGADPRFFNDMCQRLVTKLELKVGSFILKNTALTAGVVGTAIGAGGDAWGDVSEAGAVMRGAGVPADNLHYVVNPFTEIALAGDERSLGGETGSMNANKTAMIRQNYAGVRISSATTLATYTTGAGADRAGTVVGTPVATYLAAKDTMTQVIGVTAFQANLVVAAGETLTVTGVNRLNLATRELMIDASGAPIVFSGTVTEAVTLDGSGAGNLTITGPALFSATEQYKTVDVAIAGGDVVTLGGAASTIIQPNLFFHRDAFVIAGVPMDSLNAQDTRAFTKDGLSLRVTQGSDFTKNRNKVRIDLRYALGVMNPFFAGQGFGNP